MATSSESTIPDLQSIGLEVHQAFKALVDGGHRDATTTTPYHVPGRTISSEEERFRLWAHSLGLYQSGHASLDYRVRDASVVKIYLIKLLADLRDQLSSRENPSALSCSKLPMSDIRT